MNSHTQLTLSKGRPEPFGISHQNNGINFALTSTEATAVKLCLFHRITKELMTSIPLSPHANKTGDVWHIHIQGIIDPLVYAYQIASPFENAHHLLLDPYAKAVASDIEWGKNQVLPAYPGSTNFSLGEIIPNSQFNWDGDAHPHLRMQDLIIYEMHVRAFTKHPSSDVRHPGTFLGLIEKIPYLVDLGINAVELLPIQEFNENEYKQIHPNVKKHLYNFWGYSSLNFFAPMNRYAVSAEAGASIVEFKTMVKELHRHNIEVILDVVFNHTGEGNEKGMVCSFKGIDNSVYYMLDSEKNYLNYSGCGNTLNANNPIVQELIINCLRYWVSEIHRRAFQRPSSANN